jgi:hypothetical protein
MATAEALNTQKYIAIISAQSTDIATGLTQVIRTPKGFKADDGAKTKTTDGVDSLGNITLLDRYVDERKGTIEIDVDGSDIFTLAFKLGRRVDFQTAQVITLPIRRQATKTTFPASAPGTIGDTVVVDAVSTGTARLPNTNVYQILTQQPFATFDPLLDNSFAIGAGMIIKFSDDLVNSRSFTELQIPAVYSYNTLSEISLGIQRVQALIRKSDDTLAIFQAFNCAINPEGVAFDPLGTSNMIKMDILGGGRCQPWNVYDLTQKQACIAA